MKIEKLQLCLAAMATVVTVVEGFSPSQQNKLSTEVFESTKNKEKWTGPDWVEKNLDEEKEEGKKDWVAQFFNFGQKEEKVSGAMKPTAQKNDMSDEKDAWIARDLKNVGMAEDGDDWVAQDMNKIGQMGSPHQDDEDWVRQDMLKVGKNRRSSSKRQQQKTGMSKKYNAVAKDMAKTGKAANWVANDMAQAGAAQDTSKVSQSAAMRKLDRAMEEESGLSNKDIQKDMTKAGHLGGEETLQTRHDMEQTGKAESAMDRFSNFMNDVTRQISDWQKWQLKALDKDRIAEDMVSAGRSQDQEWIGQDMKMTGKTSSVNSHRVPSQEKELKEELTDSEHTKWVAKDMKEGGRGRGGTSSNVNRMAKHQLENLVAKDLNKAGRLDADYETIQHDMEEAGHAQSQSSTNMWSGAQKEENSVYQFELDEIKRTKHAKAVMPKAEHKRTAWDPKEEQVDKDSVVPKETNVALRLMDKVHDKVVMHEEEPETPPEHKENIFVHALKKVAMPWKKWEDL